MKPKSSHTAILQSFRSIMYLELFFPLWEDGKPHFYIKLPAGGLLPASDRPH